MTTLVTQAMIQNQAAGTWTPTASSLTNLDATTSYICHYIRVGNQVIFSGAIDLDPTATGTASVLLTLPIASNFAAIADASGVAQNRTATASGVIYADTANDRLKLEIETSATANTQVYFSGAYTVI
jgi:hypothetical protein